MKIQWICVGVLLWFGAAHALAQNAGAATAPAPAIRPHAVDMIACRDGTMAMIVMRDRICATHGGVGPGTVDKAAVARAIKSVTDAMVVLPAGRFMMGEKDYDEPVHAVTLRSFALAKYPVTRGQFQAFEDATGYAVDSMGRCFQNPGFAQTDDHPAVCISWADAQAYVSWISQQTSMHFRLPSEAEMEYAIRAGSKTRYPWGTDMNQACRWGNVADTFLSATDPAFSKSVGVTCNDGYAHTSPVGHYKPNAFGLYDMTGNVWVWTLDCWNDDHKDAPADGSARQSGNCAMHVLRGASWGSEIDWLRSADRGHYPTSGWDDNLGFRLARDL